MKLSARDFQHLNGATPLNLPLRRDLQWDFSAVDLQFVSDDILVSYLWAATSIYAPVTERFFIAVLRPLIEGVVEPNLRQDMEGMLAQEAMHAAAHAKLNRALAERGLPVQAVDGAIEEMLAWISDNCTQAEMIGLVAAGEQMFYSLARVYLADPSIGASMAPAVRRLLEYHLLEEVEHAAVSQDVFRYFCQDDYVLRVRTSLMLIALIANLIMKIMTIFVQQGPYPIGSANWIEFWRYALIKPGLFRLMAGHIAYFVSPLRDPRPALAHHSLAGRLAIGGCVSAPD